MNSIKNFEKAKIIEIDSLLDLPEVAKSLRETTPTELFHIKVKESYAKGHIKFPYDGFFIEGNASIDDCLYARMKDEYGEELTTWKTPTVKITGSNNIFKGITFINSAGNPREKGQQVACAIYGDNNLFIDCEFSSTQDTLFVGPLPSDLKVRYDGFIPEDERTSNKPYLNLFYHCKISGTVDFIFGAGGAIFNECECISLLDIKDKGWVTAPSHDLEEEFGYLFANCSIKNGGAKKDTIYLARPWRDYGLVTFYNCTYGEHINPLGFDDWVDNNIKLSNPNSIDRTKTARFYEFPYIEGRISWLKNKKSDPIGDRYLKALEEFNYLLK